MLFFIPAWYQQNQWCENEQSWTVRRMHTEFDDTVKQIQLFHRNRACPYRIMLLGFAPNFRHFLHRQGVYRAPYWSCFDAIQEVRRKKTAVLSFHNLKWPEGIEFVYTPFVVTAMLEKEKYAQIDFGEDGNPIRIDLYQKGQIRRCNLYDDRGFVSGTVIYEEGRPFYQDYLTESGTWKMRHFLRDGHVEINGKCPEYLLKYQDEAAKKRFERLRYDSMEQVIAEVLNAYLNMTEAGDIFCVAMHGRHTGLLKEILKEKKLILSFFEDRYPVSAASEELELIREADYLIADSRKNVDKIRQDLGLPLENIMAIPPYDSRVDAGISQQFGVQKILASVDGLEDEIFAELIGLLGRYLCRNENAQVHLFTRRAEYDRKQKILEQAQRELGRAGLEEGWAAREERGQIAENDLEPGEQVPVRFFVEQCVDELSVSKCMREQRILVDLRENPELYLQIAAISIGIPQIVRTRTEFVEHGRNGILLKDIKKLPGALHYYLNGFKNWNQAMVCSYELVREYTTGELLKKWRKVLDSVGGDSNLTAGGRGLS
ncbi:MAG: accessory Sec system protein Asp1 [Dorea sp.]|jgi:accessory secretory protein Asp1|nr:accessory Sec system protein Asp1 [Dorea sp.]